MVLLVLGAVVGTILGLIALSFVLPPTVHALAPEVRAPRERRPHEHPDLSKRQTSIPPVPAPLAPATQTPAVLDRPVGNVPALPKSPVTAALPVAVAPVVPLASSPPPLPPAPARRAPVDLALDAVKAIASDETLQQLIENGNLLQAVRRYQEQHGVGVPEAKAALEAWRSKSERNAKVAEVVETAATDPRIVAAIKQGRLIEAIKLYRAKTGVSLQDAKAAIDEWRRQLGR